MPSSSRPAPIERARPLLGTLVAVRAEFDDAAIGAAAVARAFDEIARIHQLMSFQAPDGDLARLRRARLGQAVAVDARTRAVLAFALALADETDGRFDPTLGAAAVAAGGLSGAVHDDDLAPTGDWRDVRLDGDGVTLGRPVWLDLGGVAKGYAVDRAIAILVEAGVRQVCVDAGGDLRISGPDAEPVRLAAGGDEAAAIIELADGAVASSGGGRLGMAVHFDGRDRRRVDSAHFASVVAPTCMVADALTKVVLADPQAAMPVLARHAARAYSHDAARGWRIWEPAS
ncbi:FAD:protein FMN transferase [Caulobacter sp. LARHSG274]